METPGTLPGVCETVIAGETPTGPTGKMPVLPPALKQETPRVPALQTCPPQPWRRRILVTFHCHLFTAEWGAGAGSDAGAVSALANGEEELKSE